MTFGRALRDGLSSLRDRAAARLAALRFNPSRDKTQLLVADADRPLSYLELDDETLGRFARWHLIETQRACGIDALRREMPEVVSTAMHAKVALIRLFVAMFGDCPDHVWEARCGGVTWKGEPNGGDWIITVGRDPASAIEARSDATGTGAAEGESAGGSEADETPKGHRP